ncbi:MAG TPA: DUF6263 family protein [Gemmatales bacterium]|nr:DUF6263 family protein [Gemmatales bacterium]HMP16274.1 DUF6263 family protein [Gemmatales bacterium]
MRLVLLVLSLFLTTELLAQTDKPVSLQWKFKEGEKFWIDTFTRVEQLEKVAAQNIANVVIVRTVTSYQVRKVDESGAVELEAKIESARYDNNQTPDSQKMAALFARLQGANFRMTLGPDYQLQKLDGYQEWTQKLSQLLPVAEMDRIRLLLPEQDLRNAINEGFGFLPGKEVKLNETWKKKSELNLAPAGTLTCMLNYTYRGPEKGREKITIDCKEQGSFTMNTAMVQPGSQSNFVMDSRTGTILFNTQAGKMEAAEHQYQTRGTITIPATLTSAPTVMQVTNKIQVKQTVSLKPPK